MVKRQRMIYMKQHLYIFFVIWTILPASLYAQSLGLDASDCTNIRVDYTTYIGSSGKVDVNGTCSKTRGDASGNIITYGSVIDVASSCDAETADDGNGVITYTILFNFYNQDPTTVFDAGLQTLQIQCNNNLNANVSFTNNTQTSYRITGVASASVLSSSTFESKISMTVPQSVYKVGDYVDLTILMTADPMISLKISPQLCRAASAATGGTTYDLVSSRCPVDPGTTINRTSDLQTDVKFEAFYFLQAGTQIYLECEILVCLADSTDANCDACGSSRRRRRRSAEGDYHYIRSQVFTVHPKEVLQKNANKTRPLRVLKGWSSSRPPSRGGERGAYEDRILSLVAIVLVCSLAFLLILACIKKKYDLRKYERLSLDETSLVAHEELCCHGDEKNLKDVNQLI